MPVLCQGSLSCKHTNSPWHRGLCRDLGESCQRPTSSRPRSRAPRCLPPGQGTLHRVWLRYFESQNGSASGSAEGPVPRQRRAGACYEIRDRGEHVIQTFGKDSDQWLLESEPALPLRRMGQSLRPGHGSRLWIITWLGDASRPRFRGDSPQGRRGLRHALVTQAWPVPLPSVLVLARPAPREESPSAGAAALIPPSAHPLAKLNASAAPGFACNSHNNKKTCFSHLPAEALSMPCSEWGFF